MCVLACWQPCRALLLSAGMATAPTAGWQPGILALQNSRDVAVGAAVPVGGACNGVDPGGDGGQEILENVLAAAVLVEILWVDILFQALPLTAPPASRGCTQLRCSCSAFSK